MRTLQTNQLFYLASRQFDNKLFVFVGKYNKTDNPQQTFKKAVYAINKANFKDTGIATTYDYTSFNIKPYLTTKKAVYDEIIKLTDGDNIIFINKQYSERQEFDNYVNELLYKMYRGE